MWLGMLGMKVQLNDIRAKNTWNGKEPKNHPPGFDYCRKMLDGGVDPTEPLEVYRGEMLAYTISSIGWGATKKIREDETNSSRVVPYVPPDEKALARFALIRVKKPQGLSKDAFK